MRNKKFDCRERSQHETRLQYLKLLADNRISPKDFVDWPPRFLSNARGKEKEDDEGKRVLLESLTKRI